MNRTNVNDRCNEKEKSAVTPQHQEVLLQQAQISPLPPPPPQDGRNQYHQGVGSEVTEDSSLVVRDSTSKNFMMQTLQEFKIVTKLSKFDALLQVQTLDDGTITATTPTTTLSVSDNVRYISFYDRTINNNNNSTDPTPVGNNRCQLICQMHLTTYQQAQEHEEQQREEDGVDDGNDENDKVAALPVPSVQPSSTSNVTTDVTEPASNIPVRQPSSSTNLQSHVPDTPPSSNPPIISPQINPSNKIQAVLEQIYEMIFHQHRIDVDCQRSGTFVVVLPQAQHEAAAIMVELPKPWAYEFIRQQLDGTITNVNRTSVSKVRSIAPNGSTTVTTTSSVLPDRSDRTIVDARVTIQHDNTDTSSVSTTEPVNAFLFDDETIKRRRRSSLLRRSVSSGDVFADHKKRMATYRGSIVLSQQIHRSALEDEISSDSEDDDREHSLSNESLKDAIEVKIDRKQESTTSSSQLDDGVDWVPTLTRYTSAQSILSQSSLLSWNRASKKQISPYRPILERTPSWSEGITDIQTNHNGNIIIHTANALDVIFMKKTKTPHPSDVAGGETYQLIPTQHTGNSRIAVMVQLDLPKYLEYLKLEGAEHATNGSSATTKTTTGSSVSPSHSQIRQLCRDIVHAVQTNYDGRFLMEQSDTMGSTAILDDNQNDYYVLLSDEQAVSAVESIFQFEKKSTEPLPSNNDEIRIDNNVVQSLATSGDDGNSQSLPSKSSKSRTPSLIKKEAMDQLYRLSSTIHDALAPNGDESVDGSNMSVTTASTRKSTSNNSTVAVQSTINMGQNEEISIQKNAIKSLQQRKKRQGLSSKISQMGTFNNPSAEAILESGRDGNSQGTMPRPAERPLFSSSLLLPSPLPLNEFMPQNHSTGNEERLYSSVPAGLNYEYESGGHRNRYVDEREFTLNPSHLSNFTYPSTIKEQVDLPPHDSSSHRRMPTHPPLPVAMQNRDHHLQLQNLMYPPQSQPQQSMQDHQYYQIQQEQLYQQQQLYSEARQENFLHPNRRQSALSKFSQDMIQEMLIRAHGTPAPGGNNNNNTNAHQVGHNYDPSSDLNFLGNSFGSLDDVTYDENPAAFDPVQPRRHHQQQPQQQQNPDHPPGNNPMSTNPMTYTGNNNINDISSDVPVNADAAAAAYLLGFGRYEI